MCLTPSNAAVYIRPFVSVVLLCLVAGPITCGRECLVITWFLGRAAIAFKYWDTPFHYGSPRIVAEPVIYLLTRLRTINKPTTNQYFLWRKLHHTGKHTHVRCRVWQ